MKLKKRIAAMGAAVMMAVSMMSFNASAVFKSWEDSNGMILSYTSATSSEVYANGSVTNKGKEAKYQVMTSLYYKNTGNTVNGSRTGSWSPTKKLKKGESISAPNGKSHYARKSNYKYSSYTQVMRSNAPYKTVQSDYAKI